MYRKRRNTEIVFSVPEKIGHKCSSLLHNLCLILLFHVLKLIDQ